MTLLVTALRLLQCLYHAKKRMKKIKQFFRLSASNMQLYTIELYQTVNAFIVDLSDHPPPFR